MYGALKRLRAHWPLAAVVLLVAIGVARIASTYGVFWQTYDESAHLAGGMEWLDTPNHTLDDRPPPLAEIAVAVGPYLDGRRSTPFQGLGVWREGNEILAQGGHYERTVALARAGVLPFFILSAFLLWLWTRSFSSEFVAVLAVAIYTSLPIVLAHAGLATTDMALAAMITAYLVALVGTADAPSTWRAVVLGACAGLALLAKLSALVFLPACTVLVLAYFVLTHRQSAWTASWLLRGVQLACVALGIAVLVVWAGYRFSTTPLAAFSPRAMGVLQQLFGADLANAAFARMRVPAPAFIAGLRELIADNAAGRNNYFFGAVSHHGRLSYFPVAILVKTPIAVLLLTAAGLAAAVGGKVRNWQARLPALLSVALLVCVLPSNINIGLRHLLPMFPLVAIVAAAGAQWLMERRGGTRSMVAVGALVAWFAASSARAHPDYLAYFNEIAGSHPERIIVKGDLDWGQDLKRLTELLRRARIDSVALAYYGTADVASLGPPSYVLGEKRPVTGWVAISLGARFPSDYSWLDRYTPVTTVGKSIWLYHVPEPPRVVAAGLLR
ncbi:MAG TPA: hypothetical protein VHE78_00450 [Gemmatimonadaceae bacterium]|nr:hypothetical protein [Gemmatimonadaceae bacterium]